MRKPTFILSAAALFMTLAVTTQVQAGGLCQHWYNSCMVNCQHPDFNWCQTHCSNITSGCTDQIQRAGADTLGRSELQPMTKAMLESPVDANLQQTQDDVSKKPQDT